MKLSPRMTARSPHAFLASVVLHAGIAAALVAVSYNVSRPAQPTPSIFILQPAASTSQHRATQEAPKDRPADNFATDLRRRVIDADRRARQEVAIQRISEEKRMADEQNKRANPAPIPSAPIAVKPKVTQTTPRAAAPLPPSNVLKIDADKIVADVLTGPRSDEKHIGTANTSAVQTDSAIDAYFATFKARVRARFELPAGVSNALSGEYGCDIAADGGILNPRVVETSGSPEFDRAVLEAMRRVALGPHPHARSEAVSFQFTLRDRPVR